METFVTGAFECCDRFPAEPLRLELDTGEEEWAGVQV